MGLAVLENQVGILCVICMVLLLPAICATQDVFTYSSRATYYGSDNSHGTPSGACGFGQFGRTVNDGGVTGVSRLYKNATACGACYQVRCTSSQYCNKDGVNVVVTYYSEGDDTDFILSSRAYERLARTGTKGAKELFGRDVIDVEYRRVSCHYPGYNLMFKVHEHSKYPNYLALVVIYVAGKNDSTTVELCQELLAAVGARPWKSLAKRRVRHYGYGFCYENSWKFVDNVAIANTRNDYSLQCCSYGQSGSLWTMSQYTLPVASFSSIVFCLFWLLPLAPMRL